jgi:outer membrane biosynthesis protein TonB
MQVTLTFDTGDSEAVAEALRLLQTLNEESPQPEPEPEPKKETETAKEPPKKTRKSRAKKAEPEPEPEPESNGDAPESDDEDAPELTVLVEAATKMLNDGKTAQVKAALAEAGVNRVMELADQPEGRRQFATALGI